MNSYSSFVDTCGIPHCQGSRDVPPFAGFERSK